MTKRVSIVIPNWNGKEFIMSCLKSVYESDYPLEWYEVIVVDNGSKDGSYEMVEERFNEEGFPEWRLIRLPKNRGFARACNEGIISAEWEYVVLLNNDVEVTPQWLSELVGGMDRHPECSMGTSKMVQYDNRQQLYNTGDLFKIWCTGGGRGSGEIDTGQYEEEEYVFGACAGAGIYRKALFEKIGSLDDNFFIFSEDVDFNLRAQLAGERCVYLPCAVVYHWGTATIGFHSNRHVFLSLRNDLFVLMKNYTLKELWQQRQKIISFALKKAI
ncbi:MAG: glycosyltransferase family 2 protein, partial [Candidatus Omnitrophica bacterium]|nr:glycosyltransferase family 2 protein [Candidatus Omnitrophota bacterium]